MEPLTTAAGPGTVGLGAEPQHHLQQGQGTPACAVPGEDAATSGYCLLQEGWVVAKVSDFGLSLCINPDETHVSSVHAVSLGAALGGHLCAGPGCLMCGIMISKWCNHSLPQVLRLNQQLLAGICCASQAYPVLCHESVACCTSQVVHICLLLVYMHLFTPPPPLLLLLLLCGTAPLSRSGDHHSHGA
jgi:hypothetical protein